MEHSTVQGFVFFRSWWEALSDQSEDVQFEILRAIPSYIFDGFWNVTNLSPMAKMFLISHKPTFDSSIKKSNAGKLGGEKSKRKSTKPHEDKQADKHEDKQADNLEYSKVEDTSVYVVDDDSPPQGAESQPSTAGEIINPSSIEKIKSDFCTLCPSLADQPNTASDAKIKNAIKQFGVDQIHQVFRITNSTDYLLRYPATLDWILTPINFKKILSGQYSERKQDPSKPKNGPSFDPASFDLNRIKQDQDRLLKLVESGTL